MSKVCQVTGKRPVTGHNVSHSNIKTNRRFLPNLNNVTLQADAGDGTTLTLAEGIIGRDAAEVLKQQVLEALLP